MIRLGLLAHISMVSHVCRKHKLDHKYSQMFALILSHQKLEVPVPRHESKGACDVEVLQDRLIVVANGDLMLRVNQVPVIQSKVAHIVHTAGRDQCELLQV